MNKAMTALHGRLDALTYLVRLNAAYMPPEKLQALVDRLEAAVRIPVEPESTSWYAQETLLKELSVLAEGLARGQPQPPLPRYGD